MIRLPLLESNAPAPSQLIGTRHEGFYALEERGGKCYSWTNGRAVVAVILPPGVRADALSVRVQPTPARRQRLRVVLNDVLALDEPVGREGLDATIPVPQMGEARELTVRLESETFRLLADPRELGVALESLELLAKAG